MSNKFTRMYHLFNDLQRFNLLIFITFVIYIHHIISKLVCATYHYFSIICDVWVYLLDLSRQDYLYYTCQPYSICRFIQSPQWWSCWLWLGWWLKGGTCQPGAMTAAWKRSDQCSRNSSKEAAKLLGWWNAKPSARKINFQHFQFQKSEIYFWKYKFQFLKMYIDLLGMKPGISNKTKHVHILSFYVYI